MTYYHNMGALRGNKFYLTELKFIKLTRYKITQATYYVDKQMFYFNFAEDNFAIVRVFPLEDYYKLDPDNKMETYRFGILYINEEDKFQMKEIDTAFVIVGYILSLESYVTAFFNSSFI